MSRDHFKETFAQLLKVQGKGSLKYKYTASNLLKQTQFYIAISFLNYNN